MTYFNRTVSTPLSGNSNKVVVHYNKVSLLFKSMIFEIN